MLIIQIIEFELRGPGAPGRIYIPTTVHFWDKTKISKKNLGVDYYLLLKYCTRQCTLLSLSEPNHLLNLTPKCKILSVFWTEIVSKRSRGEVEDARLEAKAKDTKKIRGQGQGQPFRGQTLSRPRTGMLEAKAKDTAASVLQKKKVFKKFFRQSPIYRRSQDF